MRAPHHDQADTPATDHAPALLSPRGTVSEAVQTDLGFFVDVRERLEQRGIYDASRLRSQRPELYQVIARLLASGICGKEEIRQLCGVAWETVAAVEADAAPTIREYKARLSGRLRLAISAAADRLIEQARAGELSAVDVAILIDKLLLLEGEATARVELVEDPAASAFRAAMAALAGQATAAGLAGMGTAGGFIGKGAGGAAGAAGGGLAAGSPGGGPVLEVEAVPVPPSDCEARNAR